ncbi:MFS transporter [Bacillus massiliigorillae]|uniref:MFS transporter n=1 Tax=Bacillus massiliigorillae TaxID=1243664 RepID=UPI0003AAD4A7|nr:MFS transporter [Bacillus massiliigorillae]
MSYTEAGSKSYKKILLSMLLGSLVTFAILYSPQPLISTFAQEFNISPSTSSFTISFATIMMAFVMLVVSVFSNAWGRKQIMGLSLLFTSLLSILSAFSPSFEILLVLRVLEGITLAGFPAIAMTYLSEEISPMNIGRAMGVYIGGSAVGGFVGRLLVGILTDYFSWNIAILGLSIFSLICSLLFWIYLPESKNFRKETISFAHWSKGMSTSLRNYKLLYLYGIGFLFLGVYVALFNYIGFPLSEEPYNLNHTLISFIFIIQLVGSWSSFIFGKLTERYSRKILMTWAIALITIGALMTLVGNLFFMISGMAVFAFGFFAGHTTASGWVSSISSFKFKSYSSSLYLFFYYAGSSVIGWSGGLFLSFAGWNGLILMICGFILISGVFVIQLTRSQRFATPANHKNLRSTH